MYTVTVMYCVSFLRWHKLCESGLPAKEGMIHSVSGCTRSVHVKLWDPLRTHAIPEHLIRGVITTRRYTNPRLSLPLPYHSKRLWNFMSNLCSRRWSVYLCSCFMLPLADWNLKKSDIAQLEAKRQVAVLTYLDRGSDLFLYRLKSGEWCVLFTPVSFRVII